MPPPPATKRSSRRPRIEPASFEACDSNRMPREHHKPPTAARAGSVYNIRAAAGGSFSCAACGRRSTGTSPVGYRDEKPICDPCLIESDIDLGMVLALVSVIRACALAHADTPGDQLEVLRELGTFARVYECFAAKKGPVRIFRIPGFTDDDEEDAK